MQNYTQENISEIWKEITKEAQDIIEREVLLEDLIDEVIINSENIFEALAKRLSRKLGKNAIYEGKIQSLFNKAFKQEEMAEDVLLFMNRIKESNYYDSNLKVLLYSKKFHSLCTHKLVLYLLKNSRSDLAEYIHSLNEEIYSSPWDINSEIDLDEYIDK